MAEEYSKKVLQVADTGAVAIVLALSKDVGILRTLTNSNEQLTSVRIAEKIKLKERYVREILGSLVGAELVQLSTNQEGVNIYFLSEEQKQGLALGAASPHVSIVGVMADIYARLKECVFTSGPYGFLYEENAKEAIRQSADIFKDQRISKIFEAVPDLVQRLESGIDVIEFGCGMGAVIAHLAEQFPNSRFTASELTQELVTELKLRWGHIPNLNFEIIDMCAVEESPKKLYDWGFVMNVVHDLPHPLEALRGVLKILQHPGGVFTFVECSPSENGTHAEGIGNLCVASLYAISTFLCIREGLKDDASVVLGACGGRTVLRDLAIQAGFEVPMYKSISEYHTLFVCKTK